MARVVNRDLVTSSTNSATRSRAPVVYGETLMLEVGDLAIDNYSMGPGAAGPRVPLGVPRTRG